MFVYNIDYKVRVRRSDILDAACDLLQAYGYKRGSLRMEFQGKQNHNNHNYIYIKYINYI